MAKQYTQAEWARIQSRLPEEDRVPYSLSPNKFDTQADVQARINRFAQVIEPGVTPDQFPASVTQPRVGAPVIPMDITSQRYTASAAAAGMTPTPVSSTSSSDALYDLKRRVGYGIDEQGNRIQVTGNAGPRTQGLPEGFIAGPFPKELEKFFGPAGDILGYRINTETDKDGNTFFTLSVAQRGAYGEGVTGFSTFGARFTRDANGNYVGYSGPGSKVTGGPTGPTGPGSGLTFTASDGTVFTDQNAFAIYEQNIRNQKLAAETKAAADKAARQSAFDLLFQQFSQYGLGGLVEPLRALIESGVNPAEFTIKLRETDAYKKRFAANAQRINKGLRALSEAEYITLEDQYQDVMRRYGLPQSFYARGDMGRQEGFEKFISGDVSPVELEDRIQTAQNRVTNAPSQVRDALSQFYGAELGNGDILAYVLDPDRALPDIKRKVTAAEIGAGAAMAGLGAGRARAEELGRFGVTGEQARQGFATIAEFLPSAQKLSDIYSRQGLGPYTQETAEQEVFGITGAAEAGRKRRKLTELETATFSGTSGIAGGALARDRAGAI